MMGVKQTLHFECFRAKHSLLDGINAPVRSHKEFSLHSAGTCFRESQHKQLVFIRWNYFAFLESEEEF